MFCPMYDFGKQMLVGSEKNACLEKLMSLYMRISICSMSENSFTMGLGANSLTQAFTVVRIFQMLSNNYKAFYGELIYTCKIGLSGETCIFIQVRTCKFKPAKNVSL